MNKINNLLLLLISLISLNSCSLICRVCGEPLPPPRSQRLPEWQVETIFILNDIGEEIGNRIIDELEHQQMVSIGAVSLLSPYDIQFFGGDPDNAFAFAIAAGEIDDMTRLDKIQSIIEGLSKKETVPLRLLRSVLTYQSVYGDANTIITVFGDATPGSIITIDDGSDKLIETEADHSGEWAADILQNEQLSRRGGRVYVEISKGNALQYLEINVLTKKRTAIDRRDLPRNSPLKR